MPLQEIYAKPNKKPAYYHSQENVTNGNGVRQISLQEPQGHVVRKKLQSLHLR